MRKKEKPLRVSSFFIYLCPVKASIDPDTTVYIFDIEPFLFSIQPPRYSISTIDSISKKGKEKNDYIYIYIWNDYLLLIRAKLYHNSTIITLIKLMQMQGRDTPIKM